MPNVAGNAIAPMTFDDATRQNFVPLSTVSYSSGGTTTFSLPTSGLAARLWLAFQGTLTNAGVPTVTATGPFSIIKRITIRVNSGVALIDCSGYGLALLAMVTGEYLGWEANVDTVQGSTSTARNNLFNYPTANNGLVNFVLPVPIAWNHRDDIALLLLQNQRAQVTVQIVWNTVTGADLTFPYTGGTTVALTGTLSPFLEFFTLPDNPNLFPDLLILHQVNEFTQTVTSTGDNNVTLQRGNTFTKILHYLYLNGALDTTDITRATLRYDQNVRPYEITTQTYQLLQLLRYSKWLPDGLICWDLAWQGLPGLGYFRDTIDSEAVSELTSIINIASGANLTAPSVLNTLTEQLLHLEPAA